MALMGVKHRCISITSLQCHHIIIIIIIICSNCDVLDCSHTLPPSIMYMSMVGALGASATTTAGCIIVIN